MCVQGGQAGKVVRKGYLRAVTLRRMIFRNHLLYTVREGMVLQSEETA